MAQWHCFKDKEPMVESDVIMDYLDVANVVEGIKCPKCGKGYLMEEMVLGKVSQAEEMLENK